MTFSEYAQMLYPLIGEGSNASDFVITLTHNIMAEPFTDKDKQKMKQNEYYPLDHLTSDMLARIYNGSKKMSEKAVGAIRARLDKERFNGYLSGFTPDAIEMIDKALRKNRIPIKNKDTIGTCTDLFVLILEDCAARTRKSTKKRSDNAFLKESEPERMLDVFNQSYDDFAVDGFIDSDPTTDRIHDMIHFIGHIREQDKMDCLDKNEEIYQGIISFIDILQEYLSFLKRSSGDLDFFPDNYTPPRGDNEDFSEELNRYREQLKSLYLPIKVEVEKQRDEKDEQRRAAGKEAWNKGIRKGSL